MKRITLYSFMVLCLPCLAGAQDNVFAWKRLPAYNAWQVEVGTASSDAAGYDSTIAAATSYVTLPLTVPDGTAYADVTIRSGTAVPLIASASSMSATTVGIPGLHLEAGLFSRKDDADLYVNNHYTIGSPPAYYVPYMATSSITYKAAYTDTTLLSTYGTYHLPVRSGYMVLRFQTTDKTQDIQVINNIGVTLTVRFARDR